MNRKQIGMSRILKAFGLPQETDPHRCSIQWVCGSECLIEQHRGILCFERDRIRFAAEQGTLTVEGEDLILDRLSESRALIRGTVGSVTLGEKS